MPKIRKWILTAGAIAVFSLAFTSGGVLLYQWWKREQIKAQIKTQEQEFIQAGWKRQKEINKAVKQHQLQKNWVNLTAPWARNPQVKQVFHELLTVFANRYAKSKQIDNSHLPLLFGGFYQKAFHHGTNQGEMGRCEINKEIAVIRLNQIYLLNKLGHERYFMAPEHYLDISFAALTETMAHELAHYIQYAKHGKSNCESSGTKDNNDAFIYPHLVREHTEFTREITEMIINSAEYEEFANWWCNPEA